MFDKLKQLRELKNLEKSFGEEKFDVEKDGIRVVVNGKMEVVELKINPELSFKEQEIIIKECVNNAIKKAQMTIAQKMSLGSVIDFFKK